MARRFAILLRAVNVGGHNRVSMPSWRQQLEQLGCTEVVTYLQSGNATVASPLSAAELGRRVRDAVAEGLGVDTDVFVRTGPQLAAIVANNPFPEVAATPKLLHVSFVNGEVTPIDPEACRPDRFVVAEGVVYLHFPNGSGRSRLAALAAKNTAPATARNWTTVLALAEATAQ